MLFRSIERLAVEFLRSLGFTARRGVQFAGGPDSPDVIVDELPNVHIEVKGDRTIGLGTQALSAAMQQSIRDSGEKMPVVLWWEHRRGWRLTYMHRWENKYLRTTTDLHDDMRAVLWSLQIVGMCEQTRRQFHPRHVAG